MRKIISIILLAAIFIGFCLAIISCNLKEKTVYYQNSILLDSLTARRAAIKKAIPIEFFDSTGRAISIPNFARGLRIDPLTSPTPIKLPLLQWNDSTKAWVKGINSNYGNRISITFLCDGYLQSDSLKALQDVNTVIAALKIRAPFSWYYNRFTFYMIFAASKQTGVGQMASACGPLVTVNNYFGSALGFQGVCRFMSCNATTVNNVLAGSMPYTDVPVVICNTPIYGGAADGSMAIITTNTASTELLIHEGAHALFGVGDEYPYGSCGTQPSWNAISNKDTALAKSLWGDTWVPWLPGCGLYLGANYCPNGLRDSVNCEMNALNQPFCPQCKKRGIYSFHYFTSNIDGYSPATTATQTVQFAVKILQPQANTIKVIWSVNGVIKQMGGNTFRPNAGIYNTIKVETYDTTKWLFKTQPPHYSQTWSNITVTTGTIIPPPPPECKPAHQIQAIPCPAGYSGTHIQTRNFTCPDGAWTAWQDSINLCAPIILTPVISATNITQSSFLLHWYKMPGVTSYDVRWQKAGETRWQQTNGFAGQLGSDGLLFRKIQNLQRKTSYIFQLSKHGANQWGNKITIKTL